MEKIEIFCSYASEDEELVKHFKKHFRVLDHQQVKVWYCHDALPGTEWERERDSHFNSARIILLLISAHFMNSSEYGREALPAMERHKRDEAYVIPIILRPTAWKDAPFGALAPLPAGGKSVSDSGWKTKDAAFVNVVEGIILVIREIRNRSSNGQPPTTATAAPTSSGLSLRMTNQKISKALFEQFMEKQYNPALNHYKDRSDHHVKVWKQLQLTLVCLAVAVAMLVGAVLFASASDVTLLKLLLACLAFLLSLTLVLVSIVLVTSYSHEKWITYRGTVYIQIKQVFTGNTC